MARKSELDGAVEAIEEHGILLVFPIDNAVEPRSLWSVLHPGRTMRWVWDDDADPRISALWRLREALASSKRVVYSKWFRGRATMFSRAVFRALLAEVGARGATAHSLSKTARALLELLEDDSPQSTKALRRNAGLEGKANEGAYAGALAELWARGWIVAVGAVDDGAFPSLAIGATRLLFEDLWNEARDTKRAGAKADRADLEAALLASPKLRKGFDRTMRALRAEEDAFPDVIEPSAPPLRRRSPSRR